MVMKDQEDNVNKKDQEENMMRNYQEENVGDQGRLPCLSWELETAHGIYARQLTRSMDCRGVGKKHHWKLKAAHGTIIHKVCEAARGIQEVQGGGERDIMKEHLLDMKMEENARLSNVLEGTSSQGWRATWGQWWGQWWGRGSEPALPPAVVLRQGLVEEERSMRLPQGAVVGERVGAFLTPAAVLRQGLVEEERSRRLPWGQWWGRGSESSRPRPRSFARGWGRRRGAGGCRRG